MERSWRHTFQMKDVARIYIGDIRVENNLALKHSNVSEGVGRRGNVDQEVIVIFFATIGNGKKILFMVLGYPCVKNFLGSVFPSVRLRK